MLTRRHRERLEEFTRPQAGAPDYPGGEMGAAVDEPGGPSGGPHEGAVQTVGGTVHVGEVPASAAVDGESLRPQKNDKTEVWRDYAVNSGAMTREEADGLGRDAIIARIDGPPAE